LQCKWSLHTKLLGGHMHL